MKNISFLFFVLFILGCNIHKTRIDEFLLRDLYYMESNRDFNFKKIQMKGIPASIIDTIKSERKNFNKRRSKTVVFENSITKKKYAFNYLDKDTYILLCYDSTWKFYQRIGSLGIIY